MSEEEKKKSPSLVKAAPSEKKAEPKAAPKKAEKEKTGDDRKDLPVEYAKTKERLEDKKLKQADRVRLREKLDHIRTKAAARGIPLDPDSFSDNEEELRERAEERVKELKTGRRDLDEDRIAAIEANPSTWNIGPEESVNRITGTKKATKDLFKKKK